MIYECYCCWTHNPLSNVSAILTKQFNTKVQFFTIDMPLVTNLVTQFMGDSQINNFSMVWCNQTETLFQHRINCIIGRCRGISKPRDLNIFLLLWHLTGGCWPTCQIRYLKHQISWFQVLRGGTYLWFDAWYSVCMNVEYYVSVKISSGKMWLCVIYCNKSHARYAIWN